ncbi:alpha/beta fold hydrolase [Streptomyces sp. NPDC020681]|uniref:alpha/beta fold hydrolase n=1 Tax=Streptomyces sp. NPDC020681 TaxID=3365083 RepID=UPI0037B4A6EF
MTGGRVLPPLRRWTEGGSALRIGAHSVFVRQDGPAHGAPVTLVHGFPTSSHDWAAVVPALTAAGLRVTTLDLLGFGESDKPRRHRYSVLDQASLVEEVWRRYGIGSTALVAHDYG